MVAKKKTPERGRKQWKTAGLVGHKADTATIRVSARALRLGVVMAGTYGLFSSSAVCYCVAVGGTTDVVFMFGRR